MGGLRVLKKIRAGLCGGLTFALLATPACFGAPPDTPTVTPSAMPRIGTVDARFQSYNIEMIEITGGRFWKPYRSEPGAAVAPAPRSGSDTPGIDSNLYQYRPPIDLANPRLRKLAAALAPAYLRVSGTWANSTYFAASDNAPPAPPAGFNGVLTRQQWRGAIDFAQAVDARIVTSFAISTGSRDAAGLWKPDLANSLLSYTRSIGGSNRRRGIHERTEPRRDGRCARRLRRERIWKGLPDIPFLYEADGSRDGDPRPRHGR